MEDLIVKFILFSLVIALTSAQNIEINKDVVVEKTKDHFYNATETAAINKLRGLVKNALYRDFMNDDAYLIRWIKDSNYNIPASAEKLKRSIEWRKEKRIDDIINEDFSFLLKVCPFLIGDIHDKEFRPILFARLGVCQLRKAVIQGTDGKFERLIEQALEKAANVVRTTRKVKGREEVSQAVAIIDMSGFNLVQHGCLRCIELVVNGLLTYEANYPYYLHRVTVINAPRVAEGFFQVLTPIINRLKFEFKVFGYDKNEWRKNLLDNVEGDQLLKLFSTKTLSITDPGTPELV